MRTKLFCFLACLAPALGIAQDYSAIVEDNNLFAFKLYREVKSTDRNVFYSPFSISTALAMTYAGARGETATQMARTLNFPEDESLHSEYRVLLDGLKQGMADKIQLNIANAIWLQKDFKFQEAYIDLVKTNYGSELKYADFRNENEREFART